MTGSGISLRDISDVNITLPVEDESILAYDADTGKFVARPKVKTYVALLSQTGTAAPVAIVLENTLGETVVWYYVATGQYLARIASGFDPEHTAVFATPNACWNGAAQFALAEVIGEQTAPLDGSPIYFCVQTNNAIAKDDWGALLSFEIRVYP